MRAGLIWLLLTSPVWAACTTVDTTGFTAVEAGGRQHAALEAMCNAGCCGEDALTPAGTQFGGDPLSVQTICFSTCDPKGVVTRTELQKIANQQEATRQANATASATAEANRQSELAANPICTKDYTTVDAYIDSQVAGALTLVDAKTVLSNVMKAMARCQLASE